MFKSIYDALFSVREGVNDSSFYVHKLTERIERQAATNFLLERKSSVILIATSAIYTVFFLTLFVICHNKAGLINHIGQAPSGVAFFAIMAAMCMGFGLTFMALTVVASIRYLVLSHEAFPFSVKARFNYKARIIPAAVLIFGILYTIGNLSIHTAVLYHLSTNVQQTKGFKKDILLAAQTMDVEAWKANVIAEFAAERHDNINVAYEQSHFLAIDGKIGSTENEILALGLTRADREKITECRRSHTSKDHDEAPAASGKCHDLVRKWSKDEIERLRLQSGNTMSVPLSAINWMESISPMLFIDPRGEPNLSVTIENHPPIIVPRQQPATPPMQRK